MCSDYLVFIITKPFCLHEPRNKKTYFSVEKLFTEPRRGVNMVSNLTNLTCLPFLNSIDHYETMLITKLS